MHELLGFMLGDVNLNGFVNIVDAQIAYDVANGLYNGKEIYSQLFNLSDVNGDWYVDHIISYEGNEKFSLRESAEYILNNY